VQYFDNLDDSVFGRINVLDSLEEEEVEEDDNIAAIKLTDYNSDDDDVMGIGLIDFDSDDSDNKEDEDYEPPHEGKYIPPDNYIQDIAALKAAIEDHLECQWCRERCHLRVEATSVFPSIC
jgi:hypothetical protein